MHIDMTDYQIPEGTAIELEKWPTRVEPLYGSKKEYRTLLAGQIREMIPLQRLHYAFNRYSLLLIFQGMDTSGKDGAIRHVMSGINPQGCQVFSFKQPSSEELDHDFLWRTSKRLPERGRIGIFNRSYYEEVLIVRVHPEILNRQGLPHELIDDPEKNWKLTQADVEERKLWKRYMLAFEACFGSTSTVDAPWYVIPADDKHNSRLIISAIILNAFKDLKMAYPIADAKRKKELQLIRETLSIG